MKDYTTKHEGAAVAEKKQRVAEPPLYKTLLHNDDYTPMDFVVHILEAVFQKKIAVATRIMLQVHNEGLAIAGIYTREVAETKVEIVHELARKNEYPLKCSMEKA